MKQYKKPEIHFVNNTGGLSGDEIAKLRMRISQSICMLVIIQTKRKNTASGRDSSFVKSLGNMQSFPLEKNV